MVSGPVANVTELYTREKCSVRWLNMTIPLAFLAPNLVKAVVEGRLPRGIGVERLRDLPTEWSRQFEALGLNPGQRGAARNSNYVGWNRNRGGEYARNSSPSVAAGNRAFGCRDKAPKSPLKRTTACRDRNPKMGRPKVSAESPRWRPIGKVWFAKGEWWAHQGSNLGPDD